MGEGALTESQVHGTFRALRTDPFLSDSANVSQGILLSQKQRSVERELFHHSFAIACCVHVPSDHEGGGSVKRLGLY